MPINGNESTIEFEVESWKILVVVDVPIRMKIEFFRSEKFTTHWLKVAESS